MSMDKVAFKQGIKALIRQGAFEKVAAKIEPYIKLRLYEEAFCDRILTVRPVSDDELIPEHERPHDDSYYVLGKVEQGTEVAFTINFRSRAPERYITGPRYKIPIGMHSTPIARKNVNELKAYDYDILADAADKDVFELANLKDWIFLKTMKECLQYSNKQNPDLLDEGTEGALQIQKVHIRRLENTLTVGGRSGSPSKDILKVQKMLTHQTLLKDVALLDSNVFGDPLTGEMFEKGFTISSILGIQYIASIKEHMFVEEDWTMLVRPTAATTVDTDVTVAGETFTVPSGSAPTAIVDFLANAINSSTALAGEGVYATEAFGPGGDQDVLRISVSAKPFDEEQRWTSADPGINLGGLTADTRTGWDRYDALWAFPSSEFIGELIRPQGGGVETEMWKVNGEMEVMRVSREHFGLGVGNANGVAFQRQQRSRLIAV